MQDAEAGAARRPPQDDRAGPTRRCGAPTQRGHPCRNPVAGGGRCRRHRGADETTGGADGAFVRALGELLERGLGRPVDLWAVLAEIGGATEARDRLTAFVRRRLAGDYEVDEFGFDEDLTTNLVLPLLRPLHRRYWRVASHGREHLPAHGAAVLVANHAGALPFDAMMTRLDVFECTGRHVRQLTTELPTGPVADLARRTGATPAGGGDADRLLAAGELVAVWPEGRAGLGKPWRERYRLRSFGRGEFAAAALRAGAPIVPTAIVGSEEIYPILLDLRPVAEALGVPAAPVVAQLAALPLLGPFALLPLPSKWLIEYGEPIPTAGHAPAVAADPLTVFDLTDRVRDTIQGMLERNLLGRHAVFL